MGNMYYDYIFRTMAESETVSCHQVYSIAQLRRYLHRSLKRPIRDCIDSIRSGYNKATFILMPIFMIQPQHRSSLYILAIFILRAPFTRDNNNMRHILVSRKQQQLNIQQQRTVYKADGVGPIHFEIF